MARFILEDRPDLLLPATAPILGTAIVAAKIVNLLGPFLVISQKIAIPVADAAPIPIVVAPPAKAAPRFSHASLAAPVAHQFCESSQARDAAMKARHAIPVAVAEPAAPMLPQIGPVMASTQA